MRSLFDWDIALTLEQNSGTSLQGQLYTGLREAIEKGQLRPALRLPASRHMAAEYGVSRNTVLAVYDQLVAEGYLTTRQGAGTYVSEELPEAFVDTPAVPTKGHIDTGQQKHTDSIHTGLPAIDAFPLDTWARIAGSTARKLTTNDLQKGDPQGYAPLREAVAGYLAAHRNVQVDASQIVIVSGLQQGLKLVADSLLPAKANIILEDPGYDGLHTTTHYCTQQTKFTSVDEKGACVPTTKSKGNLLVVSPSHQYPLGVTMPVSRRMELLEWATRTGSFLFEDDYDSEFRYDSKPISSLHGLSKNEAVLYGGSFSKATFPSLRLGYLALPTGAIDRVVQRRAATDSFPSLMPQRTLADFINQGHFARHLRRMRKIHAERQTVYITCFRKYLSSYFEITPSEAGLDMVARPTEKLLKSCLQTEESWVKAIRDAGLSGLGLSGRYRLQKPQYGVLLGFACFTQSEIETGLSKLAQLMQEKTGFN